MIVDDIVRQRRLMMIRSIHGFKIKTKDARARMIALKRTITGKMMILSYGYSLSHDEFLLSASSLMDVQMF